MRFLVVQCTPGLESEVVAGALALGYRAINVTVPPSAARPLDVPKPAFPGYVFLDSRFDPSFTFIEGVYGCLKLDEQYKTIDESAIRDAQTYIDKISDRPRGPLASLFGEELSVILRSSAVLFHDFDVVYSASVNVHRAMRGYSETTH